MKEICILRNPIQNYAWGSPTAIPELLGEPTPSDKPQAELWMGAHVKAHSEVLVDGNWHPLPELMEKSPTEILGKRVTERFGAKLPFLFKVIAAAKPLSIQAHPNLDQAREGFARENRMGIPPTDPNRNYRDDNHKPETICALTPFWVLNGFRKVSDIVSQLRGINPSGISEEVKDLEAHPDSDGLKRFFSKIMRMENLRQKHVVEEAVGVAERSRGEDPVFEWMIRLQEQYPGDIGVLSPVLLNLVQLQPGEAMFVYAGQLHAYLEGTGVELMANSDNVLRGGLTSKHIDVPELLRVLDFAEKEIAILTPKEQADGERAYPWQSEEFRLSVITVNAGVPYTSPDDRSVEILICVSGKASARDLAGHKVLELKRGTSILVPAAVRQYVIEGEATLYKASVP